MIIQLRKLQLCLNGSELASHRIDYYKTFSTLFEKSPRKLHPFLDIHEDIENLNKEYCDLFIRPNKKYVFPFGSAHKKNPNQPQEKHYPVIKSIEDQRPNDHILFELNHMR